MWRASVAVEASAALIFIVDMVTSVLLLYSMRRIYVTIRSYYPKWKSNNWFIGLQVIAFTAPTLMCLFCIISYKPQINFAGTLTYREMSYYCLFQVSISVVMLILLYVVTTYSLPKPEQKKSKLIHKWSATEGQGSQKKFKTKSEISANSQPVPNIYEHLELDEREQRIPRT